MWETISNVLTSPNAFVVLIFLAFVAVILYILVKSGVLKISTSAVQLGSGDIERNIIRQQLDYVSLHLNGLEAKLDKPEDYNEYLGKLIIEKVFDEYVNWITFNHINKSPAYVEIKQERVVSLIRQYTIKEEFRSEEFEQMIREDTKNVIEALINIREIYK
jgi:hypothetical protein